MFRDLLTMLWMIERGNFGWPEDVDAEAIYWHLDPMPYTCRHSPW